MKRIGIRGILCVLSGLLLTGCVPSAPPAGQEAVPQANVVRETTGMTLAFCASHQQNDFIMGATRTIQKAAEEAGASMTIYDANQNAAKQAGQVENLITQGIDGILIEPVSREALAQAVSACREAGIPIITFNQRVSNQSEATSFVGVDMVQGGMLEMETAAEMLNGQGNIVLLRGIMGGDAQVGREEGYQQVLARYPGLHVIAAQSGNWVREDSYLIMENWIQSGKTIDAVVSQNDDMALGALRAVEEAGLQGKIKVFGIDATPEALSAVKNGAMACTISQDGDRQGTIAVNALIDAARGKDVSPEYLIDHVLITPETLENKSDKN